MPHPALRRRITADQADPRPASLPVAGPAPLIDLQGVSLQFGRRVILDGVDLAVCPGEIVTLIGPNGAGKTSLARIALGLQRPTSGRVIQQPALTIGYVPQRLAVDPVLPLSVRRLMTLTRRAPRDAVLAHLQEAGVAALIDQAVHTLSGGELQRVLLARALLRGPRLLVLDEPVQNVDVAGQAELYGLIDRIRGERGCGILLISHDLHVVMASTDRVVCLNRHVCCAGRPDEVSRHPAFLALLGPQETRRFALYAHHHRHRHDLSGEVVPPPDEGATATRPKG